MHTFTVAPIITQTHTQNTHCTTSSSLTTVAKKKKKTEEQPVNVESIRTGWETTLAKLKYRELYKAGISDLEGEYPSHYINSSVLIS